MKLTLNLVILAVGVGLMVTGALISDALANVAERAGFLSIDRRAFKAAASARESQNNPRKIGPKGERTVYQFKRGTWVMYSKLPFELASLDMEEADAVAEKYLTAIIDRLRERRIPVLPVFIAAAWHWGLEFPAHKVATDYAREVANLYVEEALKK